MVNLVYDLETTELDVFEAEILEIAVSTMDKSAVFHQYIYPTKPIANAHIHGIDEAVLKEKNALPIGSALHNLDNFLRQFGDQTIYLIAHNNFGYDQMVLENVMRKEGATMPTQVRFADSLPIIKKLYPEIGYGNYNLSNLHEHFLKTPLNNAHSALADIYGLIKIIEKTQILDRIVSFYRPSAKHCNVQQFPIELFGEQLNFSKKIIMAMKKQKVNYLGDLLNISDIDLFLMGACNIYSEGMRSKIKQQVNYFSMNC